MKRVSSVIGIGVLVLAVGCATPGKRTAMGAGAGAAIGAGVGAAAGGTKGAIIGAGVGAIAGGSVGNYLDKQAQELKEVDVAETHRTEDGILVNFKNDVLFDTDSAILKPEAIQDLQKVGEILAKYPADRIRIEGNTDSRGPAPYNEELSLRRAQAVKNVLLSRGVKEEQMLVLGMGESKPVADNGDPAGRARNRRVELHIDVPQASS